MGEHHGASSVHAEEEGDILRLRVGERVNGGENLVRRGPGQKLVFLTGAIEGEEVLARITQASLKSSFVRARVTEILEPSQDRREHPWPQADPLFSLEDGGIGAAEFGHMIPSRQRRDKAQAAHDVLRRIGGLSGPDSLFPQDSEYVEIPDASNGWRTRLAFAVDPASGALGMRPASSRAIIPVRDMPLGVDALRHSCFYEEDYSGFERVELAASGHEVLLLLVPFEPQRNTRRSSRKNRGREKKRGSSSLPVPASLLRSRAREISARLSSALGDCLVLKVALLWPEGKVEEVLGSAVLNEEVRLLPSPLCPEKSVTRRLQVSGDGFWQIHQGAPGLLARRVQSLLPLKPGDKVADLYAGAGLLSVAIAESMLSLPGQNASKEGREQGRTGQGKDGVGALDSIEAYPVTSGDAQRNLADYPFARAICSTVEKALEEQTYDLVVVDPSRSGLGAPAVEAIAKTGPRAMVYVSCDPGSFARDVALLRQAGFEMEHRELLDIYPDTHHVETIARFVRSQES